MMRWYFAIDEAGGLGHTGEEAKLAVASALAVGGLEPHLLYYGRCNSFTGWMSAHGVHIIHINSDFIDALRHSSAAAIIKAHTIGHWLRFVLLEVEHDDEYVVYTDCDVVFLSPVNWSDYRPFIFCAGPEFRLGNWHYFNSGVMIIHVPAMQETYDAFKTHITGKFGLQDRPVDDQQEMNKYYRTSWDRMDPRLNWKPYWGFRTDARILHFHGPKIGLIEAIACGKWLPKDAGDRNMQNLLIGHLDSYLQWALHLGSLRVVEATPLTERLQNASRGLSLMKNSLRQKEVDLSFMDYRMFDDVKT